MNKKEPLKPCPFCGGEAEIDHNHVCCEDCGCMPVIFDDRRDSLNNHIKLWNTRTSLSVEKVKKILTIYLLPELIKTEKSPFKKGFNADSLARAIVAGEEG